MNDAIAQIIKTILMLIPADFVRTAVIAFVNHLEDRIKNDGKTNWEDTAVIPLLEEIKRQLGIVPAVTDKV